MGSLFSTISGQFTKPIVIGALFPAAIFLAVCYLIVVPMMPWQLHDVQRFASLDTQWKVVGITALAAVFAFLLYVLNVPIIRMYEGYPWQDGLIGTWMTQRRRKELKDAIAKRAQIHPLRLRFKEEASTDAEKEKVAILEARERGMIDLQWNLDPKESSVLPTRLGNVIRSFENYAERQYGFSAIALWPRFVAKIEPTYAGAIDDAKSSFDFMLNVSLLSSALFFIVLLLGLIYPVPRLSMVLFGKWVLELGISLLSAWLAYVAAIGRAAEWGALVRGAFDLYRRAVLQSLGFNQVPEDLVAERMLWREVSRQISWGDRFEPDAPLLRFVDQKQTLTIAPAGATLVITRGIQPTADPNRRSVILSIANLSNADVGNVVVTATLTDTSAYIWNSAELDGTPAIVVGTNPYSFSIGTVPANGARELSYALAMAG